MQTTKFELKKDAYRTARGGYARFLNIYCSNCYAHLLLYQKDGPGILLRLYLDRIFAPTDLANLQNIDDIKKIPNLVCKSCQTVIGIPYIWEEENRRSFLLRQGAFIKKLGKGVYPPAELSHR